MLQCECRGHYELVHVCLCVAFFNNSGPGGHCAFIIITIVILIPAVIFCHYYVSTPILIRIAIFISCVVPSAFALMSLSVIWRGERLRNVIILHGVHGACFSSIRSPVLHSASDRRSCHVSEFEWRNFFAILNSVAWLIDINQYCSLLVIGFIYICCDVRIILPVVFKFLPSAIQTWPPCEFVGRNCYSGRPSGRALRDVGLERPHAGSRVRIPVGARMFALGLSVLCCPV
jgi:hypothetical protein